MSTVRNVERRIRRVEGFRVVIEHADHTDMRGDKAGLRQYRHERAANNAWTVAKWKWQRFTQDYPGLQVDVLDGRGEKVHGRTILATVRGSYED